MREELKSLWIAQTIHLIEKESGRFADQDINRQVRVTQTSLINRIVMRAVMLSKQNGLYAAQKNLLRAINLSFLIFIFLSIICGASLAFSTLSQNPINQRIRPPNNSIKAGISCCTVFFWENFFANHNQQ